MTHTIEASTPTNEIGGREDHLFNRPQGADPIQHINPQLLVAQRLLIGEIIEGCEDAEDKELLEGIQALLDSVADYAHDRYDIYGALIPDGEPCCPWEPHVEQFNKEQAAKNE